MTEIKVLTFQPDSNSGWVALVDLDGDGVLHKLPVVGWGKVENARHGGNPFEQVVPFVLSSGYPTPISEMGASFKRLQFAGCDTIAWWEACKSAGRVE